MKNVMTRAWEIAREAVKKFGGKAVEFFVESLKMAWAELKGGSIEVMTETSARRAAELKLSLGITSKEATFLMKVEKAFQETYAKSEELTFKIWSSYGRKRAYITCPWYSKYQNNKGNYADLQTLELHASYITM